MSTTLSAPSTLTRKQAVCILARHDPAFLVSRIARIHAQSPTGEVRLLADITGMTADKYGADDDGHFDRQGHVQEAAGVR